jgi:hypothetical protein
VVVDAADGTEYRCVADGNHVSGGVLVTSAEVVGVEAKKELVNRFHGLVVDMEAAGVAKVAQEAQIGFRCVKAISDRQIRFVGCCTAMAMGRGCGPCAEQQARGTGIMQPVTG